MQEKARALIVVDVRVFVLHGCSIKKNKYAGDSKHLAHAMQIFDESFK